jgi:hypothetical protein
MHGWLTELNRLVTRSSRCLRTGRRAFVVCRDPSDGSTWHALPTELHRRVTVVGLEPTTCPSTVEVAPVFAPALMFSCVFALCSWQTKAARGTVAADGSRQERVLLHRVPPTEPLTVDAHRLRLVAESPVCRVAGHAGVGPIVGRVWRKVPSGTVRRTRARAPRIFGRRRSGRPALRARGQIPDLYVRLKRSYRRNVGIRCSFPEHG